MKMINKQRVQRIKNLIYAFILLIIFLPLIFMSVLSIQMFGAIKDLNTKVDHLNKVTSSQAGVQTPPDSSAPEVSDDSGYITEPEDQSDTFGENSTPSVDDSETDGTNANVTAPGNSGAADESSDSLKLGYPGGEAAGISPPADGGNTLGGGAPINKESDYFAVSDAEHDSDNTASDVASGNSGDAASGDVSGNNGNTSGEAGSIRSNNPQTGFNDNIPAGTDNLNPLTGLD